eukprot:gene5551-6236_t
MEGEELSRLKDENRSLRIKIAGVDTLSSLLNGTRDELDTVFGEKEDLEMELARLQCRCSMLEKEIADNKKKHDVQGCRPSKDLFESILRENKQLKTDLKEARTKKTVEEEGLFDPDTMHGLMAFKNEVELEIKSIQQVMKREEGESQITQISRLLGQVSKLEHDNSSKEEEIVALKSDLQILRKQLEEQSLVSSTHGLALDQVTVPLTQNDVCQKDVGVQTVLEFQGDEAMQKEFSLRSSKALEPRSPKRSSSIGRRNSKRASGDWSNIKKTHSDLFEDSWDIDNINPNEQLKVTQDLLVQANEIITIMTEENAKLVKVNAALLEELSKESNNLEVDKKNAMVERLRFLFTESSLEETEEVTHIIQDLLNENLDNSDDKDWSKTLEISTKTESSCNDNNNEANVDEEEQKKCNTRDSGVDIFPLIDSTDQQHSPTQTCITELVENTEVSTNGEPVTADDNDATVDCSVSDENSQLKVHLEEQSKLIANAEDRISQLLERIASLEEKEKKMLKEQEEAINEAIGPVGRRRLCKSVNNIPSSMHTPVTYQRIVLESDI